MTAKTRAVEMNQPLIRTTIIVEMNHKVHKRPLSRRDKEHWLFILGQNY